MINAHINIDKVCKLINISRSHFFRCFKKTFGITPAEYIMQSKIGAAKILLANTNHSISEISMRFDFSSFSHFSRTFHKYVGCTPSEYRKKNQQTHAGRIKEG